MLMNVLVNACNLSPLYMQHFGPILILCSEDDQLATYSVVQKFGQHLLELGGDVNLIKWHSSPHVGMFSVFCLRNSSFNQELFWSLLHFSTSHFNHCDFVAKVVGKFTKQHSTLAPCLPQPTYLYAINAKIGLVIDYLSWFTKIKWQELFIWFGYWQHPKNARGGECIMMA